MVAGRARTSQHERAVLRAEAEAVAQGGLDLDVTAGIRNEVEIALRIRIGLVDGWRQEAVAQRQGGSDDARGATIYATVEGYASTCDAYHRVQMDPDGEQIVRCMHEAIAKSGRAMEEIGYINYHGTSTQLNDAIESRCTRAAFGDLAERIPGSSTKSMIGHPQGASGSAGIVATALALSRGFLPPTINYANPDPDCDLDYIPNHGREASPVAALCNCLGFGSKNSAVVVGRSDSHG